MGRLGLDIEHKEYLKTTRHALFKWIYGELKDVRDGLKPDITYEGPDVTVLITLQIHQDLSGERYEIPATAWTHVGEGDDEKSYPSIISPIISFEALEYSENSTQVVGGYRDIPGVKEYFDNLWEKIISVFLKTGLIESEEKQIKQSNEKKQRGGRPTLKANDWAYEQIYLKGRPQNEVYIEWKEKRGKQADMLENPIDSFKQMLKYRKNRYEKRD